MNIYVENDPRDPSQLNAPVRSDANQIRNQGSFASLTRLSEFVEVY